MKKKEIFVPIEKTILLLSSNNNNHRYWWRYTSKRGTIASTSSSLVLRTCISLLCDATFYYLFI